MNNRIFGKTIENKRKKVEVKLAKANVKVKHRKLLANHAFARSNIFDNHLTAIQMPKCKLVLNKLAYIRMSVHDLFKHFMYDVYHTNKVFLPLLSQHLIAN